MTEPDTSPDADAAPAVAEATQQEEAFRIPDDVADALTEFAAVEQLSRGQAICTILTEALRQKGYLPWRTPR